MNLEIDFKELFEKKKEEKGVIRVVLKNSSAVEKIDRTLILKNFYKDLRNFLYTEGFAEMIVDPETKEYFNHRVVGNEWVDAKQNLNRTGDMYEKKFVIIKKEDGFELEIALEAWIGSPYTNHGRYEVKIDLSARNLREVTLPNKKKAWAGSWEFRNNVEYINTYLRDKLYKVPIIKNSPTLQKHYIYFTNYLDSIHKDVEFGNNKVLAGLYSIINKHFNATIENSVDNLK